MKRLSAILFSFCVIFSLSYAESIKLGQSAALSGPTKFLGTEFRTGLLAYFGKINKEGGVNGLTLELETLDDKYEPDHAQKNMEILIAKGVYLVIGEVGTPTSKVAVPKTEEAKIPFLFPFTGAEFLRNPVKKYVFNYRASYYQETEALVERMTTDLGIKKIAAFIQNDSYGEAGLAGIKKALAKRGMTLAAEGRYKRNTMAIIQGYKVIEAAEPEAVIMIGAYKPCAGFIKVARKKNKNWLMANVSFVGTKAIKEELGTLGENVVISQCVPFPFDAGLPIVEAYQKDLKAYKNDAEFGFVSLEGYIAGKILVEILKGMKVEKIKAKDREAFIARADQIKDLDIGGIAISFSPTDHQGNDNVYFTAIKNNKLVDVTDFKILKK